MNRRDILDCTVGTLVAAAVAATIVMGVSGRVSTPEKATPDDDPPKVVAPVGDSFETTTQSLSPHGMPAATAGTPAIPPQLQLLDR